MKGIQHELKTLAERLVVRAFGWPAESGRKRLESLSIPNLQLVIEEKFGELWGEDRKTRVNALTHVLKRAISRLEGKFGDVRADEADRRISSEEAAYRYFNLDGSPRMPHVKPIDVQDPKHEQRGKDYFKIYNALKGAAKLERDQSTITRHLEDLRLALAEILTDPAFPFDEEEVPKPRASVDDPSYISRPDIEDWYFNLSAERRRVVSLYGDAGTGKSAAAKHIARYLVTSETDAVILHIDNEEMLVRKISDVLSARTGQEGYVHGSVVASQFARLLTRPEAPGVVVIDNAHSWDSVKALLPESGLIDLKSTVIVTSRERILPAAIGADLRVDNMTTSQAAAMVMNRLPSVEEPDASKLAGELDGRPLAIEHGCALMREAGLSCQEFSEMLHSDIVELFDAVPTAESSRTKLTAIYRMTLRRIIRDPNLPLALRLLDLLAAATPKADEALVANSWSKMPRHNGSSSNGEAATKLRRQSLKTATKDLERLALVSVENSDISPNYLMHDLTHSIIRALRLNEIGYAAHAVLDGVASSLKYARWSPGKPIAHAWMHWTGAVANAVFAIENSKSTLSAPSSEELFVGAFLLRTRRQWGQAYHRTLERYAAEHRGWFGKEDDREIKMDRVDLALELISSGWLRYNGTCCEYQDPGTLLSDVRVPQLYDPVVGDFWYPVQTLLEHLSKDALGSIQSRPMIGGVDTMKDAVHAARCRALNGSVYGEQALWEEAEREFRTGFELLNGNTLTELAVKYDIVRRAIPMQLQSGRYETLVGWERVLHELYSQRSADGNLDDRTLMSQVKRAEGDIGLARLYRRGLAAEIDIELGGKLCRLYESLAKDHRVNSRHILWSPTVYQWARALAYNRNFCGAFRRFSESHRYAVKVKFSCLGRLISRLAVLKMNPVHEQSHGREYQHLAEDDAREALGIAEEIFSHYGLQYWHADALLTSWVLGSLTSKPDRVHLGSLESQVVDILQEIGRYDRWVLAQRIVARDLHPVYLLAD